MKSLLKISSVFLGVLVVVLTFFCIFQIINSTQEKHLVQSYQEKINTITRDRSLGFSERGNNLTLSEVENIARKRDFVESENVTYVRVSSSEVVVVR